MTQPWPSVGMRCVCIDANVNEPVYIGKPHPSDPILHGIYTISWIGPDAKRGIHSLSFEECEQDACWDAVCFRTLITATESEDLAVFRRIADLAGVDEALRRLEGVE